MDDDYISIKEIADKWDISLRQMQIYCKAGRIPGAKKINNNWVVPKDSKRPENIRNLSGEKRRQSIKKRETETFLDSKFLSLMSHEIRNSLNSILGYSKMIEEQSQISDEIIEYAHNINSSGKSILKLLNDTSEIFKLKAGEVKVEESVFNIKSFLNQLVEEQKFFAEKHQINLIIKTNLIHEYIFGDENKLTQILSNILNNAIKFSKAGQTVLIKIDEEIEGDSGFSTFRYIVEDHGIGMSENYLEHIFDLFSKDDSSGINELHGTGLGMSIVKQFTDLLGGSIEIESHLDYGTRVVVTMENRQATSSDVKIKNVTNFDVSRLKGKRILVAEDNELNRDIVTQILKKAGMEVEGAEDGIICVAMLEKMPDNYYDLILMDIAMPNLDGITATKLIRNLSNNTKNKIPIIATTANVDIEDKQIALQSGMNGFVEKPFDSTKLFKTIANCIKKNN